MMDWNTYVTTRDRDFGPIIKHVEPLNPNPDHLSDSWGNDSTEASPGVQIGRIINAILLCGLLLYFCLVR